MAKFAYRARNFSGEVVRGSIEASELGHAKRSVAQMKLIVLDIQETESAAKSGGIQEPSAARSTPGQSGSSIRATLHRYGLATLVQPEEMMMFFQQLQTIYAVGIPLIKGLTLVADQAENPFLQAALKQIIFEISEGRSMSEAFSKHSYLFDSITINLIRAGESSGQLVEILERIGIIFQQSVEQKQKIKSALFYPKLVLGMISLVFGVVVYFVIPKFADFFKKFGGELPPITRMMMGLSEFFIAYWYLVFSCIFAVVYGFKKWTGSVDGQMQWHRFILKIPYFGQLFLQSDMVAFCSLLSMLVRSGIPITEGLDIIKGALHNVLFRADLERMKVGIEEGETLFKGLSTSPVVPKVAGNLIGVGEEAGALEKALNSLAIYYKLQVDYKLANLSKAIEPILLLFVFGMVLMLALAVFMPLWKMSSVLKK